MVGYIGDGINDVREANLPDADNNGIADGTDPDGDGINESFGPGTRYIEQFEMSVYDRWGQLVYSTEDVNKPWDGKVGGADPVTGVYVYKFKAAGHLFPSQEGYGHVTLLSASDAE